MNQKTIYVYHDKFQPPHLGNKIVWDALIKKYGNDSCFIATDNGLDPLSFQEKQSIFTAMGIDSGNVIQSDGMFSQIQIPSKFNPANAVIVWIVSKENVKLIPSNIKPYTKTPLIGTSYYSTIPEFTAKQSNGQPVNLVGSYEINNQIINFLNKTESMSTNANMESFKKIFGFFDEYLYKNLMDKFKGKSINESTKLFTDDVLKRTLDSYKKSSTNDRKNDLSTKLKISRDKLDSMINVG